MDLSIREYGPVHTYTLRWGGRQMDLSEDGEVVLDGRILGTDPEIFAGRQALLAGQVKEIYEDGTS